jgi:biotin carboxylase
MGPVAGDPPRLLVLGAGPGQLGLLETARACGVWTVVCDRNPSAPGFPLASRRALVSTDDELAIERLAGALELDGVIAAGADFPVAVAARIADRLGLDHPLSPAVAARATNKQRAREALEAAGVPQPRWQAFGDQPVEFGPPWVVKAPDRHGQRALTIARDQSSLEAALERARAATRGASVLVEELLDGPEVTVLGFVETGELTVFAVTDRLTAGEPAFGVALAQVWPSPHAEPAAEVARRAVEALGIEEGPVCVQLRLSRGGPEVIDVAPRLGSDHDADLVLAATGIDLNRLALAAALGGALAPDVVAPSGEPQVGGAVTRFLVAPPGPLEAIEVPQGLPGVVRTWIYREPGHVSLPLERRSDRAGAVLVVGASPAEALARADAAVERIRFRAADVEALVP